MEKHKINGFISFQEHKEFKELILSVLKNGPKINYSKADYSVDGFFSKETLNLFEQATEQFPKTLENLEDGRTE